MNNRSKMRAIEKALNYAEVKRETKYIVNRKGAKYSTTKVGGGSKVKYVDKRMKNDMKALKRVAGGKKKFSGGKNAQSKSKKRR
jgi:hypothetical protein